VQNPYYQEFCGEIEFQWQLPSDPTSLTHFRKRIGVEGHEKILTVSIMQHAEKVEQEGEICIDTSVQGKNITFPADAKQYWKIRDKLLKLARRKALSLDRTYEKEVKQLKQHTRFATHPKNYSKAVKKLSGSRTISGHLMRAIERQMSPAQREEHYADQLAVFTQILEQKRSDMNKLYSLHE
jgi:transposase, IS5 family